MVETRSGDGEMARASLSDVRSFCFAHMPEWMTLADDSTLDAGRIEWLSKIDKPLILLDSDVECHSSAAETEQPVKQRLSTSSRGGKRGKAKEPKFKHGMSSSSTYTSWHKMHERCRNPNARGYADYGGRGIRVCKRWSGKNGFWWFLYDMGPRPDDTMTLDRLDNSRGYFRKNCRWATKSEQQRNRRCCK